MNRRAICATAIVVFAVGVFLRLDALTVSLWLDEFGTFWVVQDDFQTMLDRAWGFQGQSPLYYSLAWGSVHLFGESELALRFPSLVLGCLTPAIIYACARAIAGPTAGLYAAALFWLSVVSVRYAVDARPYSLVLFTVAAALTGFAGAVRFGTHWARLVWIGGGAAVAWAHYVHFPIVIGLIAAYAVLPALRARYSIGQFSLDVVLQVALVSLCVPQILSLMARRETLSWIPNFDYVVLLLPILPLLAGVVIAVAHVGHRAGAPVQGALSMALLICLGCQIAAIAGASLLGINLLSDRYVLSILIPTVVLVGTTLVRVAPTAIIVILVTFAITTGTIFERLKATTGSFAGIGYQDWRAAVDALTARIVHERNALILFRSGFVEEDMIPLGSPPPAVFAPLRSPGHAPFPTTVIPLSFRWTHAARHEYFANSIAPKVEHASRFFVIGANSDATGVNYMTRVVDWVESHWPARYRVRRKYYGGVELVEFLPASDHASAPAER